MARNLVLLALVGGASALVAPTTSGARQTTALNYQASEALPFMEKPEALDGCVLLRFPDPAPSRERGGGTDRGCERAARTVRHRA